MNLYLNVNFHCHFIYFYSKLKYILLFITNLNLYYTKFNFLWHKLCLHIMSFANTLVYTYSLIFESRKKKLIKLAQYTFTLTNKKGIHWAKVSFSKEDLLIVFIQFFKIPHYHIITFTNYYVANTDNINFVKLRWPTTFVILLSQLTFFTLLWKYSILQHKQRSKNNLAVRQKKFSMAVLNESMFLNSHQPNLVLMLCKK